MVDKLIKEIIINILNENDFDDNKIELIINKIKEFNNNCLIELFDFLKNLLFLFNQFDTEIFHLNYFYLENYRTLYDDENWFNNNNCRINYSKEQKNILINWFNINEHSPYPSTREKNELSRLTKLSLHQVCNWFINARRRYINK